MQKSSAGGNNFDDEREQGGPEIVIGDADKVQKTSYVVGHGTDPSAPDPSPAARRGTEPDAYAATVRSGGGINVGVWVVALLALAIALIYGFGLFT